MHVLFILACAPTYVSIDTQKGICRSFAGAKTDIVEVVDGFNVQAGKLCASEASFGGRDVLHAERTDRQKETVLCVLMTWTLPLCDELHRMAYLQPKI